MPQAARDEFTALVDDTLMAVHVADVPDQIDQQTVKVLNAQVGHVYQRAVAERLVRVANIARHLQRLLAAIEAESPSNRHSATVRRGLDVLSLLAQDAERQRAGSPAATLDDAVDCFVDQVERALKGERGARIMRFPQSRTRSIVSDPLATCTTPTGTI